MKPDALLAGVSDKKYFILGNEAIVRGALEGGLQLAATYPGTPSSEIGDILYALSEKTNVYFEFSNNEKVAMEIAASAAACGLRSMTFMKHVGMNVAADPFMTAVYIGTEGGFVIIAADDPSMHSSQNEQDSRYYARLSGIPMLEPSNSEEAYLMTKSAFELSERLKLPILLRTTTRVAHSRSAVKFGEIPLNDRKAEFIKNPSKWVAIPANAVRMHKELLEKREKALELSENSEFLKIFYAYAGSQKGIISSGCAFNYVVDAARELKADVDIMKIGMTSPLPEKAIADFLKAHDEVLIAEELEPYIEEAVRVVAQKVGLNTVIHGKLDGYFSVLYEYNPDILISALSSWLGLKLEANKVFPEKVDLPPRPPVLCPGCSHRSVYYAVKKALRKVGMKDAVCLSDIGCYTLGIAPPLSAADYLLCMGSSVGTGCGMSKALGRKTVGFTGDSTFFHSSLSGLINARHNDHDFLLVVLDNHITAMTGHQPNPGNSGRLGCVHNAKSIDIKKAVEGLGIEFVKEVDAYDLDAMAAIFNEALLFKGVSVVIAKRPCALDYSRFHAKPGLFRVNREKCTGCGVCLKTYACPAFYKDGDKTAIDPSLCFGCGVCVSVCPVKSIEAVNIHE